MKGTRGGHARAVTGRGVRSLENAGGRALLDGIVRDGLLHTLTFRQRMRGENLGYLSGRGQRKCKGPRQDFTWYVRSSGESKHKGQGAE